MDVKKTKKLSLRRSTNGVGVTHPHSPDLGRDLMPPPPQRADEIWFVGKNGRIVNVVPVSEVPAMSDLARDNTPDMWQTPPEKCPIWTLLALKVLKTA